MVPGAQSRSFSFFQYKCNIRRDATLGKTFIHNETPTLCALRYGNKSNAFLANTSKAIQSGGCSEPTKASITPGAEEGRTGK